MGLSDGARQILSHDTIHPVQLWIYSALDFFKCHIHENWEKMNFKERGFIGLSWSNSMEWYPYVLSSYGF